MTIDVRSVVVPDFLYGTAWKEEATAACVTRALAAGFRGLDTANQRKHYHEAGVGDALRAALASGQVRRDELFVQTKFTFQAGQDHRLPYDPAAPIATQVEQSLASSLEHLGLTHLDSLVLHGPSQADGLGADDVAAWRALEEISRRGQVRWPRISTVSPGQLGALVELATVPVAFVQNRCYAVRRWDQVIRAQCAASDIVYQAFSLLTANRAVVDCPEVAAIARRHGLTPAQVVFRFAQQVGMLPLTGSRDDTHLRDDLAARAVELDVGELAAIDRLGQA